MRVKIEHFCQEWPWPGLQGKKYSNRYIIKLLIKSLQRPLPILNRRWRKARLGRDFGRSHL